MMNEELKARSKFRKQLEQLNQDLTEMGTLCETIIRRSMKSLFTRDLALAASVSELLDELNRDNTSVETVIMRILLQQQPVASDLRYVSSAMKIVTDIRRIGIQGGDIAEIVTTNPIQALPEGFPLSEMSDAVVEMVSRSLTAFVDKNAEAARKVIAADDEVDRQFAEIKALLIRDLQTPTSPFAQTAVDLLMIAKYLERIADHAVHISGWVCYAVTGRKEE